MERIDCGAWNLPWLNLSFPLMASGIMLERKVLKPSAIFYPAFPRTKDSGRTLRMRLQLKIVTLNPTGYSKIQADLCFIRSRILFPDINLSFFFLIVSLDLWNFFITFIAILFPPLKSFFFCHWCWGNKHFLSQMTASLWIDFALQDINTWPQLPLPCPNIRPEKPLIFMSW